MLLASPTNNLVCLSGIPGAGKTTLCSKLVASGDYEYFCRDQEGAQVEAEYDEVRIAALFGELEYLDKNYWHQAVPIDDYTLAIPASSYEEGDPPEYVLETNQRYASLADGIKQVFPVILGYVKEVRDFLTEVNFPNLSPSFAEFREWLDYIIEKEGKPLDFFRAAIGSDLRRQLVVQIAIKRTVENAVKSFSGGKKDVLLDNHAFFLKAARDFWRKFLLEKTGANPVLIILQATRNTLLKVAEERGGIDGPLPDEVIKIIDDVQSIGPEEQQSWKNLIIPVERTIAADPLAVTAMIAARVADAGDVKSDELEEIAYTTP